MQLEHRFIVPLGQQDAYRTLLDLETVAACFPGAQLEDTTGDVFEGRVKVKLGPISVLYRGQGRFIERDDDRCRVVIEGRGRDSRGTSTASATVTAAVGEHPDGAEVTVTTDLDVTGPPAQLAGGAMEGVSNRLLDIFVDDLRRHVTAEPGEDRGEGAPRETPPVAAAPTLTAPGDDEGHLDLLGAVLGEDAARLVVVGIGGFVLGLLVRSLLRRRPIHVTIVDQRR